MVVNESDLITEDIDETEETYLMNPRMDLEFTYDQGTYLWRSFSDELSRSIHNHD